MNYFEHHIGDYLRDTAHLSLLEHGVYRRLLDVYYTREEPLPADCGRLIGARSRDERAALKAVLEEFFEPAGDGWSHRRCDAEIARFKGKREKAKASADARWSKSERNANADADGMRTHMQTHDERNATRAEAPARPQTPDTKHQEPEIPAPPPPTPAGSSPSVGARVALVAKFKAEGIHPGSTALLDQLVAAEVSWDEIEPLLPQARGSRNALAYIAAAVNGQRERAASTVIAPKPAAAPATVTANPDVAATAARLRAEEQRPIAKPPAAVLALRSRGATGDAS